MSFWPLARRIAEELTAAAGRGPVVDLGAGEGGLSHRLAELGLRTWMVDRRYPPAPGGAVAVAADALRLPWTDGCLGAVVAGNLLRQIPSARRRRWAREMARCLGDQGRLVVLEDEPEALSRAERNYRDCLRLLAEADASRQTACLAAEGAREALTPVLGEPLAEGRALNREKVLDPQVPLRWLRARATDRSRRDRLEGLARRVEAHGMDYGRYWFQIYGVDRP